LSTPVIVDITGSDSDGEDPTGRVSEIAVLNSGRHGAFEAQGHLELQGESVDRYKQEIKLAASCSGFGNRGGGGATTAPARTKSKIQKELASTECTRLPPLLAPGQHTASRIGAAGPGDIFITIRDTDLNSVYVTLLARDLVVLPLSINENTKK